MNCQHCGATISENSENFCAHCGANTTLQHEVAQTVALRCNTSKKMQVLDWTLAIIFLLLGGAVLIVWPFAALASVMGLAGHVPEGTPIAQILGAYLFHVGVLCYPIIYIASLILSITLMVLKKPFVVLCALIPIFYICFVFAFAMFFMT